MGPSIQLYVSLGVVLLASAFTYYFTLRRTRRGSASPVEERPVKPARKGMRPQDKRQLVLGLGIVAVLGSIALIAPRWNEWHWAHHPPAVEHRRELIDQVSRQFQCPADQLKVTPDGEIGATVSGCGAWTRLCWQQRGHLVTATRQKYGNGVWIGPYEWMPCQ
jgi:hypothetical protein